MPNWCVFNFSVRNRNKKDAVNTLYQFLQTERQQAELRQKREKKFQDFGSHWLGDLLIDMGRPYSIKDIEGFGGKTIEFAEPVPYCRGTLDDFRLCAEDGEDTIGIRTTCAWGPIDELWEEIFSYLGIKDDILISYYAEESGDGIYCASDLFEAGGDTFFEVKSNKLSKKDYKRLGDVIDRNISDFERIDGDDDSIRMTAIAVSFYKVLVEAPEFPELTDIGKAHAFIDNAAVIIPYEIGTCFEPEQLLVRS